MLVTRRIESAVLNYILQATPVSPTSLVAVPTFQAHARFWVGICFPSVIPDKGCDRAMPKVSCVSPTLGGEWRVCHYPRGHCTLMSVEMLHWVPHLRAGVPDLGRKVFFWRSELDSGIRDTAWVSLALSLF